MQGVNHRITGFKKIETIILTLRYFRCFELLDFVLSQYQVVFYMIFLPELSGEHLQFETILPRNDLTFQLCWGLPSLRVQHVVNQVLGEALARQTLSAWCVCSGTR